MNQATLFFFFPFSMTSPPALALACGTEFTQDEMLLLVALFSVQVELLFVLVCDSTLYVAFSYFFGLEAFFYFGCSFTLFALVSYLIDLDSTQGADQFLVFSFKLLVQMFCCQTTFLGQPDFTIIVLLAFCFVSNGLTTFSFLNLLSPAVFYFLFYFFQIFQLCLFLFSTIYTFFCYFLFGLLALVYFAAGLAVYFLPSTFSTFTGIAYFLLLTNFQGFADIFLVSFLSVIGFGYGLT